jgi:hypothetical protein
MDLGRPTEIRQINTYSWHPAARGPQVYRLYVSEDAGDSPPRAAQDADLKPAGWRLLATVDTRPNAGESGGQYGVSISAAGGGVLGRHRYLLLDIARTTDNDRFDQTFFSEIDVVDGREHAPTPRDPEKAEIVFDTSQTPALAPWVDAKLRPVCKQWYPLIVRMLPSEGFRASQRVVITFHTDLPVPAATVGAQVHCSGQWMQQNLQGEAAGAVVHELVHVVQRYGRTPGGKPNPLWLVEGLADYVRWFRYEPEALRPRPDPARAKYTDSYRTTAAFLNHVMKSHDKQLVQKLNEAMRAGRFSDELWKERTGKSADELWAEYVETLKAEQK